MNYIALFIGLIIAAYIIFRFKKTRLEKTKWAYPILLSTFPVYYFVFAVYANDYKVLGFELAVGILFITAAYLAYKAKRKTSMLIIGTFSLMHGIYDLFHNYIFINKGTPLWWVEFCGSIDLVLGVYLVYIAILIPTKTLIKNEN